MRIKQALRSSIEVVVALLVASRGSFLKTRKKREYIFVLGLVSLVGLVCLVKDVDYRIFTMRSCHVTHSLAARTDYTCILTSHLQMQKKSRRCQTCSDCKPMAEDLPLLCDCKHMAPYGVDMRRSGRM